MRNPELLLLLGFDYLIHAATMVLPKFGLGYTTLLYDGAPNFYGGQVHSAHGTPRIPGDIAMVGRSMMHNRAHPWYLTVVLERTYLRNPELLLLRGFDYLMHAATMVLPKFGLGYTTLLYDGVPSFYGGQVHTAHGTPRIPGDITMVGRS